jgi:hypothetical protein
LLFFPLFFKVFAVGSFALPLFLYLEEVRWKRLFSDTHWRKIKLKNILEEE